MTPPDALMLLTRECAYCPAVLQSLSQLVKEGELARLEVVNISVQPAEAEKFGVRTVPWFRIGEFEFTGTHPLDELRRWARGSGSTAARTTYVADLLRTGGLNTVVKLAQTDASWIDAALALVPDLDAELQVRVGVSAVLEHFQNRNELVTRLPKLLEFARHADARVRADAGHYLGLTGARAAIPTLKVMQNDPDAQVREIATDSLAALNGQ